MIQPCFVYLSCVAFFASSEFWQESLNFVWFVILIYIFVFNLNQFCFQFVSTYSKILPVLGRGLLPVLILYYFFALLGSSIFGEIIKRLYKNFQITLIFSPQVACCTLQIRNLLQQHTFLLNITFVRHSTISIPQFQQCFNSPL